MKFKLLFITVLGLVLVSCIRIEDVPIVTANPTVSITTNVTNGQLHATFALNPGITFIVAGNVELKYLYFGSVSIINAVNGDILASQDIDAEGAVQIITISTDTSGIDEILILAQGELDVYAKDSDKTYLTSSPFYGQEQITYYQEIIPDLTVAPTVEINTHISGGKLKATVIVDVNPGIRTLGTIPIIYKYEASVFLIDTKTDNQLAKESFNHGGTTQYVEVAADTTGHDRMLVKVLGQVVANADKGNDGNPSNDIYITSGQFYAELEVIINP